MILQNYRVPHRTLSFKLFIVIYSVMNCTLQLQNFRASCDASHATRTSQKEWSLFFLPENGFSVGAWNLAADKCSGDILVQLSDDWECPFGWDEMIEQRIDPKNENTVSISECLKPWVWIALQWFIEHP